MGEERPVEQAQGTIGCIQAQWVCGVVGLWWVEETDDLQDRVRLLSPYKLSLQVQQQAIRLSLFLFNSIRAIAISLFLYCFST